MGMAEKDEIRSKIELEAAELAEQIARQSRRGVARAISRVEDNTPVGRELLNLIFARTGKARRIGITGPPGAGKSTFVNELIQLLRQRGERVGVLAVDPSSPFSGGAILGDRIRMTTATGDDGLFVRSMASRGSLGGVAAATYEASEVLEAAGFDWILIETVGVGQSELEVIELTDTTVLLLVPESGDSVQAMKAGIMEGADIFVVNKFDREGGGRLIRDIQNTLDLCNWSRHGGWQPPVVPAKSYMGEGVPEVLAQIEAHYEWLSSDAERYRQVRIKKTEQRLRVLINRAVLEGAWSVANLETQMAESIGQIEAREISLYGWVEQVMTGWRYRRAR
jgi:GTPase